MKVLFEYDTMEKLLKVLNRHYPALYGKWTYNGEEIINDFTKKPYLSPDENFRLIVDDNSVKLVED